MTNSARQVLIVPATIVEMQQAIELYEHLLGEMAEKEEEFPHVQQHFIVLGNYIHIISMILFI